jgi:hypothetical protein
MCSEYLNQWNIDFAWSVVATNDGHILFSTYTPTGGFVPPFSFMFKILTKQEVSAQITSTWYNGPIAPLNATYVQQYANRLANQTLGMDLPSAGTSYTTDFVFNALRTYNVYIHSSMQQFASQGPSQGDSDVIAAIPVLAPLGSLNVWQASGSDLDVFPIPNMMLNTLTFYLTDDHGQRLALNDGYCTLNFKIYDAP